MLFLIKPKELNYNITKTFQVKPKINLIKLLVSEKSERQINRYKKYTYKTDRKHTA